MLWGLEGYDPATVLEALADAGEDQVAEAIRWLTFGAFHQKDMPLDQAIEFLRLALHSKLPADGADGVGWLSRVERIDSDAWLDLTLSAIQAGNGVLDQPDDVAVRAATRPDDERAIRIVAGLLAADIKLWHLEDVGRVGLQLVNASDPATHDAREELREQLLKREFFDAHEDASSPDG